MAKDERLYARFDIGMDEHPKVMLLSDAAFRALIEATFYARRQMTDGFLDERVAVRKWGREVLDELAGNHPERPSLAPVSGGWQIRDYHEHQTTRADIEAKREAGRKGGLAKAKQAASKPVAPATKPHDETASKPLAERLANGYEPLAKTETETETETKSKSGTSKRGTRLPEDWAPSPALRDWTARETPTVDARAEFAKFRDYWSSVAGAKGVKLDWDATWRNWCRRQVESVPLVKRSAPSPRAEWCPVHAGWPHPDSVAGCDRCKEERAA